MYVFKNLIFLIAQDLFFSDIHMSNIFDNCYKWYSAVWPKETGGGGGGGGCWCCCMTAIC